jgi:hypothetical protein
MFKLKNKQWRRRKKKPIPGAGPTAGAGAQENNQLLRKMTEINETVHTQNRNEE